MNQDRLDKKHILAILCQTLKYKCVLEQIIVNSKLLQEKKLNMSLALLLVHDLLFGKLMSSPFKPIVIKHKTRLAAELVKIKIKLKVSNNLDLIPSHIRDAIILPRYYYINNKVYSCTKIRYVRVNTLKTTVESVAKHFTSLGYLNTSLDADHSIQEIIPSENHKGKALSKGKKYKKEFHRDAHLDCLLVLPPNSDLHMDPFLLNGKIILQDKASCFPAFILNPPQGSLVVDACAAPGNKTSHLSAIMKNTGKIIAFDMDKRRLDTLIKLTNKAGCKNIETKHESFLDADPMAEPYNSVDYILLDPSCSGSGIVGRMDHLLQSESADEEEQEIIDTRLESLAEFQKQALVHALSFPNVKKVVYSTCSKHIQENEGVVAFVLQKCPGFKLSANVFPGWDRRGIVGDGYDGIFKFKNRKLFGAYTAGGRCNYWILCSLV